MDAVGDNPAAQYWNNYDTYAAVTSRNLNMEYVSIAASGIALKYPWAPGYLMPSWYDAVDPLDPQQDQDRGENVDR